jgi:hypothetical protein
MTEDIWEKWDKAWEHPGEFFPVGRTVICDVCGKDWTDRTESGGFLFSSYAYCPDCAERGLASIKEYNEERYIRAFCPEGEAYADFARRMRGPDAGIKITKSY